MAQLDETITTGDLGHETDHEALARKANYVFDVTDYGAVGTGWVDDTSAIQDAVDAAHAAGGGVVFFPTGTWRVTQIDLTDTRGVTLRGVGNGRHGTCTIRTHSTGADSMIRLSNTQYLTIEKVMLFAYENAFSGTMIDNEGSGATWESEASLHVSIRDVGFFSNGSQAYACVKVGPAFDWVIRDCHFHRGDVGVDGVGTGINSSNTVRVEDCWFGSHFVTALIQDPGSWAITGNTVEPLESGAPGFVKFQGSSAANMVTVSGNWCGDTLATGTWIEVAGSGWVIAGNLLNCASSSTGVKIVGDTDGLSVTGNWFYSNGTDIDFGTTATVKGVSVVGNYIPATSSSGNMPDGTIWQFGSKVVLEDATVGSSGGTVGFFGTSPVSKPTVTGARDDGTALADLLTELATLGLIVDSSTAT